LAVTRLKRLLHAFLIPTDVPKGPEWLRRIQVVTESDMDTNRVFDRAEELSDEGTLADSGLATNQDNSSARFVKTLEKLRQQRKLKIPL
jgi:hypothetical protein